MATPEKTFDVVIIGAGINGAGVARDAAMRGLSVLLLDKGDIGGGTSAWSTRLIHGGLRYLEHGEFGLVRESLRERETLLKIAPHLVRPLPLVFPIYRNARRGPLTIRMGMWLYDLLLFDKSLPRHRMLSREETLQTIPQLERTGLTGAALYHDAQVEFAERLVLENVIAAVDAGAKVRTYTRVDGFDVQNEVIPGVRFTDLPTGTSCTAYGKVIINAAGPWVDQVLKNVKRSPRLIGGTKGSHIIVPRFADAPTSGLYIEASIDHRPFFVLPWNDKYLIGTTDLRFEGNSDDVRIDENEITYLLNETNRVLPSANLTRDQILYSYSGVRPLPFTRTEDEQRITRRHFIRPHPEIENLYSIVGGKLTTYRNLAEEVVDKISRRFGLRARPCLTAITPLPGASSFQPGSLNERLFRIYGTRAAEILKLAEAKPELAQVFDKETGAIAAEIVFAFKHELAQTLTDCLMRRTMVGLNSSCGLTSVENAADIAQRHLGWTRERTEQEIRSYRTYLARLSAEIRHGQ